MKGKKRRGQNFMKYSEIGETYEQYQNRIIDELQN